MEPDALPTISYGTIDEQYAARALRAHAEKRIA